jgi:hypothetical protein
MVLSSKVGYTLFKAVPVGNNRKLFWGIVQLIPPHNQLISSQNQLIPLKLFAYVRLIRTILWIKHPRRPIRRGVLKISPWNLCVCGGQILPRSRFYDPGRGINPFSD